MATSFKQLFCEQFNCPPQTFSQEVLVRSIYPHALPFLKPMLFFEIVGLKEGLALIDEIGRSTSPDEVDDAIIHYQDRLHENEGVLVGKLKLRISCKRLLDIYNSVTQAKMPLQSDRFDQPAGNVIAFPEAKGEGSNTRPPESTMNSNAG
jgi:hypothetical protein